MNAGENLANYVGKASFRDFPNEVIEKAKYLILDSIGCALGGAQTELGKIYIEEAKDLGGKRESTVIVNGAKVSSMNAANANAQLANLLDFDDTYDLYPPAHPGCEIIQTALAVGEAVRASGVELLTAVVLGYDVSLRVGRAVGSFLWTAGVPFLAAPMGPAAVAAKLFGLDREAIKNAFDIVEGETYVTLGAPIPRKHDVAPGPMVGSIKGNYGLASVQGIMAARQARRGLTGIKGLLAADLRGWHLAGLPVDNYDELAEGLGKNYKLMDVSFKPTPSCRLTHPAITAAWQALDNRPTKADEINEIVISGVERLKNYECATMLEAQFSIPYALALAISGEEPGPRWYTTGRFKDADIRELASKVKFEHDPEAEKLEIKEAKMLCTVEIGFTDGRRKKACIRQVKGAPDNPMSQDELLAKFKANATSVVEEAQVKQAIDSVMNLEKLKETSRLLETLV